jgi:succinate dehydrogenase (ubiquinone) cytochrome b560 subunit
VPEFYGKPSPYTSGTGFLGTPTDHLEVGGWLLLAIHFSKLLPAYTCYSQRVAKRPVSPHVFEIDGKGTHYKMPINAISSIVNRATGVALSVGGFDSFCSL